MQESEKRSCVDVQLGEDVLILMISISMILISMQSERGKTCCMEVQLAMRGCAKEGAATMTAWEIVVGGIADQ